MNSNNHILGTFKEVWEALFKLGYQSSNGNKTYKISINPNNEPFYEELCSKMTASFWSDLNSKMNISFRFQSSSENSADIYFEGSDDNNDLFRVISSTCVESDVETGESRIVVGDAQTEFNNSQEDNNDLELYLSDLIGRLDPYILMSYLDYLWTNTYAPIKSY